MRDVKALGGDIEMKHNNNSSSYTEMMTLSYTSAICFLPPAVQTLSFLQLGFIVRVDRRVIANSKKESNSHNACAAAPLFTLCLKPELL